MIGATLMREGQEPACAWRAPGILAASPATLEAAATVNAAKAAFQAAVQDIAPQRRVRIEEIRRVVPWVMLKQCYRAIPVLAERPRTAHFTWAVHGARSRRRTVREWIGYLESLRDAPREGEDPARWGAMIGAAQRRLATLPAEEVLVQREPVAPHPRANLWLEAGVRMLRVSLPILYPDDADELIPYRPLGVADRRTRRAPRRQYEIEPEPVCRFLHLYRYCQAWRDGSSAPDGATVSNRSAGEGTHPTGAG